MLKYILPAAVKEEERLRNSPTEDEAEERTIRAKAIESDFTMRAAAGASAKVTTTGDAVTTGSDATTTSA